MLSDFFFFYISVMCIFRNFYVTILKYLLPTILLLPLKDHIMTGYSADPGAGLVGMEVRLNVNRLLYMGGRDCHCHVFERYFTGIFVVPL